jgi:hypothetical protein
MKRIIIFVFILLVTFSTINAVPYKLRKRETIFQPCPEEFGAPLNVKVSPDPPKSGGTASFDISGTAKKPINEGDELGILFVDLSVDPPKLAGEPFIQKFCGTSVKCPVESGASFETKAEQVKVPQVTEPFGIMVLIVPPQSTTASACALAVVGKTKSSGTPGTPGTPGSSGSPSPAALLGVGTLNSIFG